MTISLKKTLISVVFTALISTPAFANQTVDVSMTGVPCRDGAMGYSANDSKSMAIGFATGRKGTSTAPRAHCRIPIDTQRQAIQFATGQHGMSMKSGTGPCAGMEGVGTVTSLNGAAVTLQHKAMPAMDWPDMTMAFDASDPTLLSGLAIGDKVSFRLKAAGDHYVIDKIAKQ